MRIVFVTNNYTPYSGGVVSSINASVQTLRTLGHEVFIITLDFLDMHDDPEYVLRIPSACKFVRKKNHLAIPWRPYYHMLRIIKDLKPDIIHTHHPVYLGNTALKIVRQLSIPIVFTYHTMYEHYTHYIPLPQWIMRFLVTKKVRRFCSRVNGIIAPSNYIQRYIQSHISQIPVRVIPSGLQELFVTQQISLKTYDSTRQFQLLYVGRFTQEKNISFLLDMMQLVQRHGNFKLTLVGYGSEYERLCDYAYRVLNMSELIVQFIYKPSKQTLLHYYQQADLFLFPSFSDTQGIVLAEAMACSVPVVAVHGPGQENIICNGYNGFLVNDIQDMIKKIIAIASDKSLHFVLQQGAFETSKNYHPEYVTKQLLAFYEEIIKTCT